MWWFDGLDIGTVVFVFVVLGVVNVVGGGSGVGGGVGVGFINAGGCCWFWLCYCWYCFRCC